MLGQRLAPLRTCSVRRTCETASGDERMLGWELQAAAGACNGRVDRLTRRPASRLAAHR